MRIVNIEMMQRLDRETIKSGTPGIELMERAGEFVAEEALTLTDNPKSNILVLVGGGNNGGDGFVAARLLHNQGIFVNVLCLSSEEKLNGDALVNYERLLESGLTPLFITEIDDSIENFFDMSDLIIDALLGTGTRGAPKNLYKEIIDLANKSSKTILSVDIPSGVQGDTGQVPGNAIEAEATVTFAYPKIGQFVYPGREKTGNLHICDIGILPELIDNEKLNLNMNLMEDVKRFVPIRPSDGHKGTFGKGYILAGSRSFTGAAILTALSFLRSGSGMAYVGTPNTIEHIISLGAIEAITQGLPDVNKKGALSTRALGEIHKKLIDMDAAIVGPGLGSHHETIETIVKLMKRIDVPTVVDADGLNALSKHASNRDFKEIRAETVFTPHVGELSRLLNISIEQIEIEKYDKASEWAAFLNTVLVIKGSPSLIAEPDGAVFVNTTGNNGMATAGSGDVLSGIIGGFLAQGLSTIEAARLGVYMHGLIGELTAEFYGKRTMIASDMFEFFNDAFEALCETSY